MTQDGGTRGGTSHDEMNHCRESQGWTAVSSSMPERDRKKRGDDSPKQACLCRGSLAIVDQPQGAWTCIIRAFFVCLQKMPCSYSLALRVFFRCFILFLSFRFY